MGAKGGMGGGSDPEMVFWTSSEVPEIGSGLVDYQTNPAVDRWLQEKVLLAPTVTRCAVPKGIFGEGGGAMLRMIAYGTELNLAHPPRPDGSEDRVGAAVGGEGAREERRERDARHGHGRDAARLRWPRSAGAGPGAPPAAAEKKQEDKLPDPVNILRGILGR